ncbi:DUF4235 domain-containing protein [Nocardioides sp. CFH 31398]|uniref:DUF4235 domain-containing protein n=1 Tax=Nocardioides sp. CFH 31398 TaxID=2919579 RepID=UPI001F06832D|nr:DUF4235 domain-containing protein [Nocardioides sp. CFH 31398]MCH1865974.1 DUF4235 domain-containing protein [Nocardioides sp. CFH 31398]
MPVEETTSRSAKILYRPWGILSSVVGGMVAGKIFQLVWGRLRAGQEGDPPKPLESEYDLKEVLAAAAVQGAIFFVVRAAINRGGARAFQRWTGEWPGD